MGKWRRARVDPGELILSEEERDRLGLRAAFGRVYPTARGRNGWRLLFLPWGYVHSDRGTGFRDEAHARKVRDGILAAIRDGKSPTVALAPYMKRVRLIPNAAPQEPWREDYKRRMIEGAKRRAKKSALPFSITARDLVVPDRCPVLGIRLEPSPRGGGRRDSAPSIDRLVPEYGYVPGNVIVISWRANVLKLNATAEELLAVANWLQFMEHLPVMEETR